MENRTIRVGVIGAGTNTTKLHIPGFQAIDGVEVTGVVNRSRESSQRVADKFSIPKVYDSWNEAVTDPNIDAICVGTWPYLHHPIVLASLENGKHVMTEARMAMDAAQAYEMLEASLANPGLVTQVVPAPFTIAAEQTLKDLISDGYLGNLLSVDMVVDWGFADTSFLYTWRNDRDLSGYNIMLLGAVYECLMRLVGHVSNVSALTKINVPLRAADSGEMHYTTIPDLVEVIGELPSGATYHIRFSTVTGLKPPHHIWLFGSEGTLKLDFEIFDQSAATIYGGRRDDSDLSMINIPQAKRGVWRVESEFIDAIRGNGTITHTPFTDGVRYMEFIEAVSRSAQEQRSISLPL
jgi:predicted dehydrogenase